MKRADAGLLKGMTVMLLAGLILGIVTANLVMTETVREASPFTAILEGGSAWEPKEGTEVFFGIFAKRLCLFVVLWLVSCATPFLPTAAALGLAAGGLLGVYQGGAALSCGAAGFGLSLAALVPQAAFYGGAALVLLQYGWKREKGRIPRDGTFITHILGAAGLYFMGILTESYANPAVIRLLLKIL